MSEQLEELRIQRELIQKHLDWLDAKIKDAEKATSFRSGESNLAVKKGIEMHDAQENNGNQSGIKKPFDPDSIEDSDYKIEDKFIQHSSDFDINRIKIGCFILFAGATLLFLFLLFGLPYLLD